MRVLVARRRERPAPVDPGRDRDRGPAGGRLDLVPAGLPGVSERRRRLRRRRTNLAPIFGLIAAAALLIDYVMTVVGVDRRRDRARSSRSSRRPTTSGSRSRSSRSRSSPSPTFAACASRATSSRSRPTCSWSWPWGSSAIGLVGIISGTVVPVAAARRRPSRSATEALGILLLLKAFAGGSVALTGVEAIANGVPGVQAARGEERGEHDDGHVRSCSASCSSD